MSVKCLGTNIVAHLWSSMKQSSSWSPRRSGPDGSSEIKQTRATKEEKFETSRKTSTTEKRGRRPSNLLRCSLPGSAGTKRATGGRIGAILVPMAPFLAPPLKCCSAMCTALMFALYPTCKAIIIHASWQSRAWSLLHLQLLALGYDITVRLISSRLHIAACVSLSLPSSSSVQTERRVWIQPGFDDLKSRSPLSLRDTSVALITVDKKNQKKKNLRWCFRSLLRANIVISESLSKKNNLERNLANEGDVIIKVQWRHELCFQKPSKADNSILLY